MKIIAKSCLVFEFRNKTVSHLLRDKFDVQATSCSAEPLAVYCSSHTADLFCKQLAEAIISLLTLEATMFDD
jgi:hypothetical protein